MGSCRIDQDALELMGPHLAPTDVKLFSDFRRILWTRIQGSPVYHRLTHFKIARSIKLTQSMFRGQETNAPAGYPRTRGVITLGQPRSRLCVRPRRCCYASLSEGGRS